ncbi:MAG: response regulator [Flavobacteriales bacterium]|nr:response regulator [Flavobacteriales bacterium]
MDSNKILIVDDNEINSLFMSIMFSKMGISFDTAQNQKDTLTLLQKNSYKLILLDIHMPKENGYDVARAIRTFDSKTPIVAFTSLPQNAVMVKAMDSGMNEYIHKSTAISQMQDMFEKYGIIAA